MKKSGLIFRQIFNVLAFFLFVYPLTFSFFPYLSTRNLLAVLGLVYFLFSKRFPKQIYKTFIIFFLLIIISLLTSIIHSTSDFALASIPILFIVSYFSFYALIKITHCQNVEMFTYYFTFSVLLQLFISIIFFIFPELELHVYSYLNIGALAQESLMDSKGFRLHGLGANFFSSGVTHSLALILIAIFSDRNKLFYTISYALVAVVSLFMARTTLIGVIISFPLLLKQTTNFSILKLGIVLTVVFGLFKLTASFTKNSDIAEIQDLYIFGFELLENYQENGNISSTGSLASISYKGKLPVKLSTWIIGDGLYADPTNPKTAYYMGVDQGYLRCLYYFGLIGTIILLFGYYKLCQYAAINQKSKLFYLIFLLYLIIMYKGHIDIYSLIIPYVCLPSENEQLLNNSILKISR